MERVDIAWTSAAGSSSVHVDAAYLPLYFPFFINNMALIVKGTHISAPAFGTILKLVTWKTPFCLYSFHDLCQWHIVEYEMNTGQDRVFGSFIDDGMSIGRSYKHSTSGPPGDLHSWAMEAWLLSHLWHRVRLQGGLPDSLQGIISSEPTPYSIDLASLQRFCNQPPIGDWLSRV